MLIFYLTQYIKPLFPVTQYNYYTIFFMLNLLRLLYILPLQKISIQTSHISMLDSHMWLIATILNSTALKK